MPSEPKTAAETVTDPNTAVVPSIRDRMIDAISPILARRTRIRSIGPVAEEIAAAVFARLVADGYKIERIVTNAE